MTVSLYARIVLNVWWCPVLDMSRDPLYPIPVQKPFQIVGVDIMELPITEKGNKYVIVFQDFLTKWPLVFAAPDQDRPPSGRGDRAVVWSA